jgi:FdhD protein
VTNSKQVDGKQHLESLTPVVAHSEPVVYLECQGDDVDCASKPVVIESAWSLVVNGQHWVTILCTPTKLNYFVLGFLYNEGLITTPDEVLELYTGQTSTKYAQGEAVIRVELKNRDLRLPQQRTLTSGCGSGITFVDLAAAREPVQSSLRVTAAQIADLMARLVASVADDYRRVGGFHTAGLGGPSLPGGDGYQLLMIATDIGRHNTLDKVAGECLARNICMREAILLTTGRVSAEMLGKAARMQVPIVATLNSPTHLAVELARAWRLTLIGYARGAKMHVYTGWQRVCAAPPIVRAEHDRSVTAITCVSARQREIG